MFSLVVLYSNDRVKQFRNTIALWEENEGYAEAEKILCVDGKADFRPNGFRILEIPRRAGFYCWADALNGGVEAATKDYIFYFDSDRVVPKTFFTKSLRVLEDRPAYVFPRRLFSLTSDADVKTLRRVRDDIAGHKQLLKADHRVLDPRVLRHKNPFSGCVGFRKADFLAAGGFDPAFVGWGYPDYDFFMKVHRIDPDLFVSLDVDELHQRHGRAVNQTEFLLQNFWNLNQYVTKWGLPRDVVETRRVHLKLPETVFEGCSTLADFLAAARPK